MFLFLTQGSSRLCNCHPSLGRARLPQHCRHMLVTTPEWLAGPILLFIQPFLDWPLQERPQTESNLLPRQRQQEETGSRAMSLTHRPTCAMSPSVRLNRQIIRPFLWLPPSGSDSVRCRYGMGESGPPPLAWPSATRLRWRAAYLTQHSRMWQTLLDFVSVLEMVSQAGLISLASFD